VNLVLAFPLEEKVVRFYKIALAQNRVMVGSGLLSDGELSIFERTHGLIMTIPPSNPKMVDERREIHELNFADYSIQAFLIRACKDPLGKHLHREKAEIFIILNGMIGHLITAKGEKVFERREWHDIPRNTVIVIPPGFAHTFYAKTGEPESTMICFSDRPYNETAPDFVPVPLVLSS